MPFNSVTEIINILFQGWDTNSWKDVLVSAIIICAITISFEGLKIFRSYVVLRRSQLSLSSEEEDGSSSNEVSSMSTELIPSNVQQFPRKKIMLLSLETVVHMLSIFFGYILMLLVMTYSIWFLLAIIIGSAIGFFIFHPITIHLTSKFSQATVKSADHFARNTRYNESFNINTSDTNEGLIL